MLRTTQPLDSGPCFALLFGRSRFIGLCHSEPACCPRCLEAIADFLAREMGFDPFEALDQPAERYRALICGTADAGHELRRRTVLACWMERPDYAGFARGVGINDLIVADDLEPVTPRLGRMEAAA